MIVARSKIEIPRHPIISFRSNSTPRSQQAEAGAPQQGGADAVEQAAWAWLAEPALHIGPQARIDGDGGPFQQQEQHTQPKELLTHRGGAADRDELRQERGEDQDGLGVT